MSHDAHENPDFLRSLVDSYPPMRLSRHHLRPLLSVALVVGCASTTAPGPRLEPELFFDGQTFGEGVLEFRDGSIARRFEVESRGVRSGQEIAIEQSLRFDDGETRARRWTLTKTDHDRYRGTLTEASGPVRARRRDGVLTLSYALATVPLGRMRQTLTLQPGGRQVINEGQVRVLGVVVRRMYEVIEIVSLD